MKHLLITSILALAAVPPAMANQDLAKSRNCMACHAIEKKLVGPAFKDVAKKYAGQGGMVPHLAEKIIKGGGGAWGPVPMPANNQVSETEARQLATWVLGLQ